MLNFKYREDTACDRAFSIINVFCEKSVKLCIQARRVQISNPLNTQI